MRILIFNADYLRFQSWFYGRQPELRNASYAAQMAARNATLFGVADFYSRNFGALGHPAADIHVNNPWMQSAWASERGMKIEPPASATAGGRRAPPAWLRRATAPFKPMLRPLARKVGLSPKLDTQSTKILLAQVEDFRPDLIFNQDVFHVDTALMRRIKAIGKPILIGQVGIDPPLGEDLTVYDLMLSLLPRVVQSLRARSVRAEVRHLAFEPAILDALPANPSPNVEVSFVGQVSVDHRQRITLLEAVARRFDLKFWGLLPDTLPASSPLHRCFQGELWGTEMYQALRRSRITLNSHIDLTGREAGNMRLFEATGAGAFLLTDFKDNLHTLFAPEREVAVWRSVDDCIAAIERYLVDDKARGEIARAGQARTMAQHTYRHRVAEILALVETLAPRR
jgi:spore maturation protein CgeB